MPGYRCPRCTLQLRVWVWTPAQATTHFFFTFFFLIIPTQSQVLTVSFLFI